MLLPDLRWVNLIKLVILFCERAKFTLQLILDLHAELARQASLPHLILLQCLLAGRHRPVHILICSLCDSIRFGTLQKGKMLLEPLLILFFTTF